MEKEDIEAVINHEPVVEKKQRKKFKEYYADPEFKKRHLEYVNEKIECACGRSISRSNYSKHLLNNSVSRLQSLKTVKITFFIMVKALV